jgi:MFS family permease
MASVSETASSPAIRSLIPARIDRLPWSRFHTRLVMALGVAWILDGLEITIASNVAPDLTLHSTLNMSAAGAADIATWYLIGEVIGALFFGQLSDRLGRRNLFMVTLGVYLVGSGLTAITPRGAYWFLFLYLTRVIAGMGIGGEYAAINSAIDEMIPARFRGRVDLAVNGTYWAGAFIGTLVTIFLLNHLTANLGWRIAYVVGPALALIIIYVRRNLPESPRWQLMHGRESAAEGSIREIEEDVEKTKGALPPVDPSKELEIQPETQIGYLRLLKVLFQHYPTRSVLGAALMITQSFLYNAIFFTYGLVLTFFFHVNPKSTGYYFLAFAAGNLLGPLTIGHLFDTIGRRKMISSTYIMSGILLVITAQLFKSGVLNATTQTIAWSVIFFFASAGASAGYLTVSEIFPLEVRAKAIAVFFAIAQCFGSLGSHLYGHLIGTGNDPTRLYIGYLIGAGAMILGGVTAIFFGVDAEGKSLEDVATPLSVVGRPAQAPLGAERPAEGVGLPRNVRAPDAVTGGRGLRAVVRVGSPTQWRSAARRRLDALLGRDAPRRDGGEEPVVVALVLVGVRDGEVRDGLVEHIRSAEIGGDRDAVPRPRVCPGERPPAQPGVHLHAPGLHRPDVQGELPVPELADVEVPRLAVEARHPLPAKEDVAGCLHEALTGHHSLALVGVPAGPGVAAQCRPLCLFHLQEEWV